MSSWIVPPRFQRPASALLCVILVVALFFGLVQRGDDHVPVLLFWIAVIMLYWLRKIYWEVRFARERREAAEADERERRSRG